MAAIDVGSGATAYNDDSIEAYTYIDKNNPANASGTITKVYFDGYYATSLNIKFGIFREGASNVFTTVDFVDLGLQTTPAGLAGIDVDLDIEEGDYIGFYCSGEGSQRVWISTNSGDGYWRLSGDYIDVTDQSFSFTSTRKLAIYGTGETASTGTNMKINIGDAWKDVDSMKINVGDVWKDVAEVKQNIGDVWKTVY